MSVFVLWEDKSAGPITRFGPHVVAVLDTDEIHDLLPGISSRRAVADSKYASWLDSAIDEVRKHAPQAVQSQLEVCFLDQNLEGLLAIVGHGMPELSRALGKDRLARDKILHKAAADEELVRKACTEMSGWEALVTTVARLIMTNVRLVSEGRV
jgi:hypothetical protein